MKKYITYSLALCSLLSLGSCDDFLEVNPKGVLDEKSQSKCTRSDYVCPSRACRLYRHAQIYKHCFTNTLKKAFVPESTKAFLKPKIIIPFIQRPMLHFESMRPTYIV